MRNFKSAMLCFISISFFFIHCSSTKNIADDKPQIDPNFSGNSGTLLIVRNYDSRGFNQVDRTVRKNLIKYYKGTYLFISTKDRDSPKYANTDIYHFLIVPDLFSDRAGSGYITRSKVTMIDRKTGKEYSTKLYSSYDAFKEYPQMLENARITK